MATITGTTSASMTYDAFGRMVEKAVGSAYTQIVYSPLGAKYAVMSGTTLQKGFIPLPTGATAVYTPSGLAYIRHYDHLGSSRLATTPNRTLYSSTAYAPFGEAYASTGTTDLSFTGQDQDTTSGMHDFLARRYMPVQGRWLSPDPKGIDAVDPSNPQTWNRYAYVMNNPLALVDPFGEDCYQDGTCGQWSLPGLVGGGGGGYDPFGTMGQANQIPAPGAQCFDGGCTAWMTIFFDSTCQGCSMPDNQFPIPLVPANNGTQQQQQNQQPSRLKDCAKAYYGFNTLPGAAQDATRVGTLIAAAPLPKSWLSSIGIRTTTFAGGSDFTSILSVLGQGAGTAASGTNLFRIAGRWAGPIAIASGVIDATAIGICASDYQGWLPHF